MQQQQFAKNNSSSAEKAEPLYTDLYDKGAVHSKRSVMEMMNCGEGCGEEGEKGRKAHRCAGRVGGWWSRRGTQCRKVGEETGGEEGSVVKVHCSRR